MPRDVSSLSYSIVFLYNPLMSPEDSNRPERRVFRITPKHSNKWLVSQRIASSDARKIIAGDMVLNVQELAGGELDLKFILDLIHFRAAHANVKGVNAVALSGAPTVGSVALRMGRDMDFPEIVIMSAYYFYQVLDQRSQELNLQIEREREGFRKFGTEEQRKIQLEKEVAETEKVATFRDKLRASLTQFAEQKGLSDPKYLEILRRLTFMLNTDNQKERTKIIDLLKTGDIDGAYEVLQEVNIKKVLNERV